MLGHDALEPCLQRHLGGKLQHVVGSIAQGQSIDLDVEMLRKCGFQQVAAAVRIAGQLFGCACHTFTHHGARTARIFVARELDDVGDAKVAGQLVDGFTRLIGVEAGNALVDPIGHDKSRQRFR